MIETDEDNDLFQPATDEPYSIQGWYVVGAETDKQPLPSYYYGWPLITEKTIKKEEDSGYANLPLNWFLT